MDHEFLTTSFMGVLAMQFGALIGFFSTFYGLLNQSVSHLIPNALIIAMYGIVVSIAYTFWHYRKERKKLTGQIKELKKEYAW